MLFVDNAWDIHEVLPVPQPKIVFFGTPTFAIHVLEELELARITPALIVTAPDKRAGRGQEMTPPPVKLWAQKRSIPILQFGSLSADEAINILGANKPDIFIVAAYGKIIPKAILDIPMHGTLNVHPSLLPKYRGASPVQSTILAGDKTTGVSIMLLDEKMDHGPIVASEEYDIIDESITAEKLEEDLACVGGELLAQIIPDWIAGKIKTKDQDHEKATYTKKFTNEDGRISPEKIGTPEAERIIQALSQNPGTFSEIIDKNGKLIRLKLLPGNIVIPAGKKKTSLTEFKKSSL
ncbi:MAG: methionyl-tRNA formyltransferase [Patescibacteria group bacterium]